MGLLRDIALGRARGGSAPELPLIGHGLAMALEPLTFLVRLAEQGGDAAPIHLGPLRGYLVSHPELVDQVMRTKAKHYSRMTPVYEAMKLFLGNGILTSEGEHWRKHRRIVQPAFHKQRLATFAAAMIRITSERLGLLEAEVDASAEMMRITLGIVSETLLGVRTDRDAEEIADAIDASQRYIETVIGGVFQVPRFVPTENNRRMARAIATMNRIAQELIDRKRREPGDDVLTMLVEARDEEGAPLSDEQIRDELITLMAAGHETTANSLSWTLLLLSRHPLVRRRLEQEVDDVLRGRPPTVDLVPKLVYTRYIIEESLRLYPPAWATGRMATEAHVLEREDGTRLDIPKGTFILLSPWVTHHRADIFESPEGFDPDRWEALGKPGALHAFAFFPFGGGPRKCVGEAFAYLEATIVLAMIAQRVRFDLVPAHPVELSPQITLGLERGLKMTVTRRELRAAK